jgi:hypothetical protein
MRRASDKIPAAIDAEVPTQPQAASDVAAQTGGNGSVEKCVNCQYYDRRNAKPTDGKAPLWGQCRRQAPQLNPVTAKAYVVEVVWPLVRDDDWCGEWEVLTRVNDWAPEALPVVMQSTSPPVQPQQEPPSVAPATPSRGRHAPANATTAIPAGDD